MPTQQTTPLSLLVPVLGPILAVLCAAPACAERIELRQVSLDLPAAPAILLPVDLDGDGLRDLVTALVYTRWDQRAIEEWTEMDQVEGLVEVLTIVPSLDERRELRVWLADPDLPTGYRPVPAGLELDRSILALEAGPPGMPVLALTDDGVAELVLDGGALRFEPRIADRPVLAGTGTLVPGLDIVRDLDGDGVADLLFPALDGAAIYLGTGDGLAGAPASRVRLPSDEYEMVGGRQIRRYPLPEVRDVDGDGLPDLLFEDRIKGWARFHVVRNLGGGRFGDAELVEAPQGCDDEEDDEGAQEGPDANADANADPCLQGQVGHFGDLDGDGVAEWALREDRSSDDAGMRQEIREAKNPPFRYFVHRGSPADGFRMADEPYVTFDAVGYTFERAGESDDSDFTFPGGLQDLDGDGDLDLIAITLDFSAFQIMRVMATRTFGMGIDFHLFCQDEGGFRPVPGLDLSGKFRIHLDDVRLSHLSLFEGDFDADGRRDFVQMGRGRDVTIHRGRADCRYPTDPDWTIRLEEEPRNLALVRIEDFDGDGRSDLGVLTPEKPSEAGVSPPVRLDLYLSADRAALQEASR